MAEFDVALQRLLPILDWLVDEVVGEKDRDGYAGRLHQEPLAALEFLIARAQLHTHGRQRFVDPGAQRRKRVGHAVAQPGQRFIEAGEYWCEQAHSSLPSASLNFASTWNSTLPSVPALA